MNKIPEGVLKEQAARERRRIEHYTEQIRNPIHGLTGLAAQDADEWHRKMIAGAQNRLKQIEERIELNRAYAKAQPVRGTRAGRQRKEVAQHGPRKDRDRKGDAGVGQQVFSTDFRINIDMSGPLRDVRSYETVLDRVTAKLARLGDVPTRGLGGTPTFMGLGVAAALPPRYSALPYPDNLSAITPCRSFPLRMLSAVVRAARPATLRLLSAMRPRAT